MTDLIHTLSYSNTFGDWIVQSNDMAGEINNLLINDFIKNSGTLYLDDPSDGLFVASDATINGVLHVKDATSSNLVILTDALITGNVNIHGDLILDNVVVDYRGLQNSINSKVTSANLTSFANSTSISINIDTGSNTILYGASSANAGLMLPDQVNTLSKLVITSNKTLSVANTITLSGNDGKTLSVANTITLTGTDSSTLNVGTGGTLGTGAFAPVATINALLPALSGNTGTYLSNDGIRVLWSTAATSNTETNMEAIFITTTTNISQNTVFGPLTVSTSFVNGVGAFRSSNNTVVLLDGCSGGGGGSGSAGIYAGSGGGVGVALLQEPFPILSNDIISVSVGTSGSGGAAGTHDGNTGGSTIITNNRQNLCLIGGGGGIYGATTSLPGTIGGTASSTSAGKIVGFGSNDTYYDTYIESVGRAYPGSYKLRYCFGGTPGVDSHSVDGAYTTIPKGVTVGNNEGGGGGGCGPFGNGGAGGNGSASTTQTAGSNASGYGAGGGGGGSGSSGNRAGGNGTPGFLAIWYKV